MNCTMLAADLCPCFHRSTPAYSPSLPNSLPLLLPLTILSLPLPRSPPSATLPQCVTMRCSKRFQSLTGQENFSQFAANNNASMSGSDLEVFKLEILAEVKREIQRAKLDIIEGEAPLADQSIDRPLADRLTN